MKLSRSQVVALERILGHAVVLNESSRLKNEVYGVGDKIYILGHDRTVLLRFDSPVEFSESFGFPAGAYDSEDFSVEGERVIFRLVSGDWKREKTAPRASEDPEQVAHWWEEYSKLAQENVGAFTVDKGVVDLLNLGLSHLEIVGDSDGWRILQRDIYTGELIRIEKERTGDIFALVEEGFSSLVALGMRTQDFAALFAYSERLEFMVVPRGFYWVKGGYYGMEGLVGGCLYDGLGTLEILKEDSDGRKEPKRDVSKQKAGKKVDGGAKEKAGRKRRVKPIQR